MARILDIRNKSNQWLSNLSNNVIRVIEGIDQQTVDFNRMQMLSSKNGLGQPLIHNRTGSEFLSKAYARRMNKSKPNIYVDGSFQSAMFLTMPTEKEYFITSDDEKIKYLPKMYDNLFGISPDNRSKVQAINDKAVIEDYLNAVMR